MYVWQRVDDEKLYRLQLTFEEQFERDAFRSELLGADNRPPAPPPSMAAPPPSVATGTRWDDGLLVAAACISFLAAARVDVLPPDLSLARCHR